MANNFWNFSLEEVVLARHEISDPASVYIFKVFRNLQDDLRNQRDVKFKESKETMLLDNKVQVMQQEQVCYVVNKF